MRLVHAPIAVAVIVGAAHAAEPQIVSKGNSFYGYGYEGGVTEGAPNGYAYGMGGLEQVTYDSKEKILYGVSEQGFITLIDFGDGPVDAPQLPIVIRDKDTYTAIKVCSEEGVLFATTKDDPNPGTLTIYKAATRSGDDVVKPELIHTIEVGYGPDMVSPNSDCSILAIANEGEGKYDDELINPEGSVSLVKGPFLDATAPPAVSSIGFPWTDNELLAKGIHMPISENAMEYWDDYSAVADEVNFSAARADYSAARVLEPEWLVWSADEKHVLVNLQENSALVKINVEKEVAEDIYSYGLKSWEDTPIDVVEDGGCANMPKVPGLYSVRTPDSITAIVVGDDTYIATANEGDDVEYGAFEEKLKAKDIFDGNKLGMKDTIADPAIFNPSSPLSGQAKYFNSECEAGESADWCSTSMRFTVGSSMVDYSDPAAPVIKRLVAIGGRGVSIYKLADAGLELVWDSGDEFEKKGCEAYPWAHNGIQDEEFADVNGTLYMSDEGIRETLEEMNDPEEDGCEDRGDGQPGACALGDTVDERSPKDGYAAEAIATGEACGNKYLVTVSEKNSVGFLYDISNIASPKLAQVFHLSPASETKNPVVAYKDRTLGEIDAESIHFFDEDESPTGQPGILFAGAWSTTLSFWEFDCGSDSTSGSTSGSTSSSADSDRSSEADCAYPCSMGSCNMDYRSPWDNISNEDNSYQTPFKFVLEGGTPYTITMKRDEAQCAMSAGNWDLFDVTSNSLVVYGDKVMVTDSCGDAGNAMKENVIPPATGEFEVHLTMETVDDKWCPRNGFAYSIEISPPPLGEIKRDSSCNSEQRVFLGGEGTITEASKDGIVMPFPLNFEIDLEHRYDDSRTDPRGKIKAPQFGSKRRAIVLTAGGITLYDTNLYWLFINGKEGCARLQGKANILHGADSQSDVFFDTIVFNKGDNSNAKDTFQMVVGDIVFDPASLDGGDILSLSDVGKNGKPTMASSLGECEGDCDSDHDCEGELVCFTRDSFEPVPRCWGKDGTGGSRGTDYCVIRPPKYLQIPLLGECQGDCDSDDDCEAGLVCFMRKKFTPVPGCDGAGARGKDYCVQT